MRKVLLVLAAGMLVAGVFAATAAASHSWGNYHWARTANPFTLKVGDNVSSTWDGYLDTAITDWNPAPKLELFEVAGQAKNKQCRPTTGRVEVCNGLYGNNGWLGIASINISGSHITAGTTKVNDTYFNTATYNTPAWRRLVMCQEIAHDFGLDHQDEKFDNANLGSCMDYTNDPDGGAGGASSNDPSNEHPNAHDFQQIDTIYTHLDSTSTIGAAVPTGEPQRVERTDRISDSTIVEHFTNGTKRITHVFWAIGTPRDHAHVHDHDH
jgi:hypothetical protein